MQQKQCLEGFYSFKCMLLEKKQRISYVNTQLKKVEKEEKIIPKESKGRKSKKVKEEMNEVENKHRIETINKIKVILTFIKIINTPGTLLFSNHEYQNKRVL